MKKFIQTSIFLLIVQFAFGQSVTISPNQTTNSSNSSADNIVVKSTLSTAGVYGYRHNGTLAAPTAVTSGQELFKYSAGGSYSGGSFDSGGSLRFTSTENWNEFGSGTKASIWTVPNGGTGQTERMTVNHDGKVGIGISSPVSNLHIHQPSAAMTLMQLTNSDAGTASTDGLKFSYNNNSFLFPYQANIMNQENFGGLGLGTNNLIRLNIDYQGDIRAGSINAYGGSSKMMLEDNSSCCGTVRATLKLLESELNDGARLQFANQNSTTNSLFWDIFGNPKASGNEANADMNFYYSTANGAGNNVFRLFGNGNAEHQGFTKLGDTAPSIKMKKLTGTTNATQGLTATVSHGLGVGTKIISIRVMIDIGGGNKVPDGFNKDNGYECNAWVSGDNVLVENKAANSSFILNKGFSVLVIYEE
jgi:hypothetical protein